MLVCRRYFYCCLSVVKGIRSLAFLISMMDMVQSLRVLLQQGVHPSWFTVETASTGEASFQRTPSQALGSRGGDLRHYLLSNQNPILRETVFAEVLLKALEPYRRAGEATEFCFSHESVTENFN